LSKSIERLVLVYFSFAQQDHLLNVIGMIGPINVKQGHSELATLPTARMFRVNNPTSYILFSYQIYYILPLY